MTEYENPVPAPPTPSHRRGVRRAVATLLLSAGLLAVGGTAVVLAADPSPSSSPPATAAPSTGGTSAPSSGGTTNPAVPGQGGRHGDCPNDGSGAGAPVAPTTPDQTQAPSTTADPSSV